MTTYYEIPLSPNAQTFQIPLAGVTYSMTIKWNWTNASWILDIADASGNPLISGIPLVTGADLLEQYGYVGIGGSLYVQTDNEPNVVPGYSDLGITGHVYFAIS